MSSSEFAPFFLSSTSDDRPLRIGVMLDGPMLTRMEAGVLEQVRTSDFADLRLLIYHAQAMPETRRSTVGRLVDSVRDRERREGLAWGLYWRIDRAVARLDDDPLAKVDAAPLLAGTPSISVRPITRRWEHRFPLDALEQVRAAELDVILRFGFNILRGDILDAARYGVWSFHHGDNERFRGGPACFWEMVENEPVTGVVLQRLTEELDAGLVLARARFATDAASLARNRQRAYYGAQHLVIQKLKELHESGWQQLEDGAIATQPYRGRQRIYRRPSNAAVVRWFVPKVARHVVKVIKARLRRDDVDHWAIAIRVGAPGAGTPEAPDMSGFRWIEAPRGHFFADPFLLEHGGRMWMFFEDYDYSSGLGRIACTTVDRSGNVASPSVALTSDRHLSYPLVFGSDGEVYMLPESYDAGAVRLYRAADFPTAWEEVSVLARFHAVDTSILRHEDTWWFFSTIVEPRGSAFMLMLFFSDELDGRWMPHPMNPISLDVRNARGAGAPTMIDGTLVRPSQDCSVTYGYSITLNEILELSRTRYRERPLRTIEPTWDRRLAGVHTFNRCGDVEVIDGKRRVRRDLVS